MLAQTYSLPIVLHFASAAGFAARRNSLGTLEAEAVQKGRSLYDAASGTALLPPEALP